ncbi:MAG: PIN domain-containing protein [Candidatus Aminicenantes bacterium]|nr:PIN domain-containing protein [Candidatus Aminicenantes bacterium]NIM79027.1 PIN domain-containing protein [Candidatus Aminicenantes bacterium]NIN18306.1 PIN domain-containing protein [Candidatus Aminicenantes bacterium]NIN42193.1 PIN domain-containing protein [Candidatus Aminicenantes bacterium]NIN84959.1 PIN domain-containing protein [Candidatus Aminicenantes bacterium]
MSGHRVILDSNIIIYLSKGLINIEDLFDKYDEFFISIITYMEVMGFQFSNQEEKDIVKGLLNKFEMISINLEIAEIVISIRERKRIKLPDAIILATAKYKNCDLLTRNVRDFSNVEEAVNIIDPLSRGDG